MGVFRKFPRTFWVANTIELFERWAWYGFFMLFANYLTGSSDMGGLEFTQSQKGILMGVGTGILYFLPVLTGAIADRYGYKKVLALAFVIYTSAFVLLPMFSTFTGVFPHVPLLGSGCRLFKPIISATIAKTTTDETASIGFGIYYMMVNIGASSTDGHPLVQRIVQPRVLCIGWCYRAELRATSSTRNPTGESYNRLLSLAPSGIYSGICSVL
ncbi:MAG: MFS transporter [Butyricimonas paravirosa]